MPFGQKPDLKSGVDADALREANRLSPLVAFAVARREGASSTDYWDLATVLELACLGGDRAVAGKALPKVLLAATDAFKIGTTLANIEMLNAALAGAGQVAPELEAIVVELAARCKELRGNEPAQS